jgi:hypothetical protein
VEITESVVMQNPSEAIGVLENLSKMITNAVFAARTAERV